MSFLALISAAKSADRPLCWNFEVKEMYPKQQKDKAMISKQFQEELKAVTKRIFERPGVMDVTVITAWDSDWLAELAIEDDYRNHLNMSVAKIHGEWVIWVPSIESPIPMDELDNHLFQLAASQLGILRRENEL